ncbi:MAG: RnfABCDGE type electron transport complex subunit D [Clostridia bacterium]|nr:RnfABCDGE type electron transport complex subunit D [Clostridia bacterium]
MKINKLLKRDITPVRRGTNSAFLSGSCSVAGIMLHVIAALIPVVVWAVYLFGFRVLMVIAISVASAVASDALLTLMIYKKPLIGDLAAVVSGVMLALTLPAATPLWIPAVGGLVAMAIKQLAGGTGNNFLNPALFARTVIMLIFGKMMIYTAPGVSLPLFSNVDPQLSAGTAMAALNAGKFPNESVFELLYGKCAGNIGEISALLILLGGAFLILRGIISYKIPLSFAFTVMAITYLFPRIDIDSSYAIYSILSGGVLFAAFFMATDHATSPCTTLGQVIYGVGCGGLTVLFRYTGVFYDGAYPAVLIMNELARPLDLLAFSLNGPVKKKKKAKKQQKEEPEPSETVENGPETAKNAEITEETAAQEPEEIKEETEETATETTAAEEITEETEEKPENRPDDGEGA